MDAHSRRVGASLFGLVLAIYLFTAGGSLTTTDAVVAFAVTRQLVEHRSVALPRDMLGNEAHRGKDGRYYSPFGIAQSLFNVPFFVAGRVAARATGLSIGRTDAIEKAFPGTVHDEPLRFRDFMANTRKCRLYDFDEHRWLTYREAAEHRSVGTPAAEPSAA